MEIYPSTSSWDGMTGQVFDFLEEQRVAAEGPPPEPPPGGLRRIGRWCARVIFRHLGEPG